MFKDKLKELRTNHHLTQEDLGNIIHVSRSLISKWELGNGLPTQESLEKLCSYFQIDEEYLLDRESLKSEIEDINKNKFSNGIATISIIASIVFIIISLLKIYHYEDSLGVASSIYYPPISIFTCLSPISYLLIGIYLFNLFISLAYLYRWLTWSRKKQKTLIYIFTSLTIVCFVASFIVGTLIANTHYFWLK